MKNNYKKGFVVPLVIAIVVILIAGGVYWWVKSKEVPANNNNVVACTQEAKLCPDGSYVGRTGPMCEFTACPSGNQSNLIKSCANGATNPPHCNADLPMPLPVITSISPSSGPISTITELKGTNLAGFEGDLDAIIENSKGETAYLPGIGSVPRTDQTIRVKIEGQLCKSNNGYSGLPCSSYLTITPGIYKIYTAPWGVKSNIVQFTVVASSVNSTSNWKTYTSNTLGLSLSVPKSAIVKESTSRIDIQNIPFVTTSEPNDGSLKYISIEKGFGFPTRADAKSQTINGILFAVSPGIVSSGTQTWANSQLYQTNHNNYDYIITLKTNMQVPSNGIYPNGKLPNYDSYKERQDLEKIVYTFKFTN